MRFTISDDLKINLPVEKRLRCYVYGGLMSEYNVRVYSQRKSKANWLAFKEHGDDFGHSNFIDFCEEVTSTRLDFEDAYEFSSSLEKPLSKGAEILLKSSSSIIEDASDIIFIPNGLSMEVSSFLEELLSNKLIGVEKRIEQGLYYRLFKKGLIERLHHLSLEYHITDSEVVHLFSKTKIEDVKPNVCLNEIKELLKAQGLDKDFFEGLPKEFLCSNVRIYSGEWGSWWKDNGSGYTNKIDKAGTYSLESALSHSGHCGPSKHIKYVFC